MARGNGGGASTDWKKGEQSNPIRTAAKSNEEDTYRYLYLLEAGPFEVTLPVEGTSHSDIHTKE